MLKGIFLNQILEYILWRPEVRWMKQNSANICSFTVFKTLPFLISNENKVFCLGTGDGQTEVLNEIKVCNFLLVYCTLFFIQRTKMSNKKFYLSTTSFVWTLPVRTGSDGRQNGTRQTNLQQNVYHPCKFHVIITYTFWNIGGTTFV